MRRSRPIINSCYFRRKFALQLAVLLTKRYDTTIFIGISGEQEYRSQPREVNHANVEFTMPPSGRLPATAIASAGYPAY